MQWLAQVGAPFSPQRHFSSCDINERGDVFLISGHYQAVNVRQQVLLKDFVSHHLNPALFEPKSDGVLDDGGSFLPIKTRFAAGEIELGAAMFRLELWRRLRLQFVGFGRKFGFAGVDGRFYRQLAAENVRKVVIRATYVASVMVLPRVGLRPAVISCISRAEYNKSGC